MSYSTPVVCVFFQLPPSHQLFMRIHDIPWLILLPQIEKLTYALEAHVRDSITTLPMKTLLEARDIMGDKILPLRDVIRESWEFTTYYLQFVDVMFHQGSLTSTAKMIFNFYAQNTIKRIKHAQKALCQFQDELENIISRLTSIVGGDSNSLSVFVAESNGILSVVTSAIAECYTLLEECNEGFEKIYKQSYDREIFECNPPSDAEYKLVRDKWMSLESFLDRFPLDWFNLRTRMSNPYFNRAFGGGMNADVQDTPSVAGILCDAINPEPEAPQECLPRKKAKIPFWRKVSQRFSTCVSSGPFC